MASEKLVDWWNSHLPELQARIEQKIDPKDDTFFWGQLVWQELRMWETIGETVYGEEGLDFIVNRRGFTPFQRDFLIKGLKHLDLWGGEEAPAAKVYQFSRPGEELLVEEEKGGPVEHAMRGLGRSDKIWDKPQMWLGAARTAECPDDFVLVSLYPFGSVVNPLGVHLSFGRWKDIEGGVPPRPHIEAVARAVEPWVEMGRPILWHCQAGINRSSLALAYYMCSRHGMTADEAISRIRAKRNHETLTALFNQSFVEALRKWFP